MLCSWYKDINIGRFLLAWLAVLVVLIGIDYPFHVYVVDHLYEQTANLWRTSAEMKEYGLITILAYIVMAKVFVYIYHLGYKTGGLCGGLGYGALIGIFVACFAGWAYVVLPLPAELAIWWAVECVVLYAAMGLAVALTYKPKKSG